MPLQTQEEAEAIYNTDDKSYETKKACCAKQSESAKNPTKIKESDRNIKRKIEQEYIRRSIEPWQELRKEYNLKSII